MPKLKDRIVPFDFVPFSQKQSIVMSWWTPNSKYKNFDAIICDGAVRSGKTVSEALSFVLWSMSTFDGKNFALCGKTVGGLRRNVIGPLKQMLKSTGYVIEDARNEGCLCIGAIDKETKKKVTNYYYIFGGKDESSQDLIQGITLAGVFFDEVALMPQSFVNQATARCSVEGAKFWFSCNPNSPFHWFKKEWINKVTERKILYLHFTMDDNPSLSEEVKNRYKALYTGVFYKRYILGLWVAADGIVYPMFDPDIHAIELKRNWTRIFVAGDFGIQNATTFGIFGYYAPERRYHQIASYYHSGRDEGQKTTKEYADDLKQFLADNLVMPEYVVLDPSAAPMIVELRKDPYFARHGIDILPAKNRVDLGIQVVSFLLNERKFTLDPSCVKDIEEFTTYAWDSDKLDKGVEEVIKIDDHAMDKIRYAILTDSILNGTLDREIAILEKEGEY
jgi:PBSX family phage terminase large subunit